MEQNRTMKEYHEELKEALENPFLRDTLDRFAVSYRKDRATVFADVNEQELIKAVAEAKDAALARLEDLYARFKQEAEKRGVIVHRAATGDEANAIIRAIAKENNCTRIIKSKSMTGEEIHLNKALEADGYEVAETDLGEWIIQLRREGPSHMVLPAIHLSRFQVAETFTKATGNQQDSDVQRLVKVARRELRAKFAEADMGITGGNFALADSGTVGICTNEGNGRLTATLPRVLVSLCGLDKLVPGVEDALRIIGILPRNATGQIITSYVSWMGGAVECMAAPDRKKTVHVIFLDNGRTALAKDPVCGSALRCVRCGACANVCPVYRMVGGHKMGHIYIGAIGLILTYFFHGRDQARSLVQNCINCEACKDICSAGIDLPGIIQEIRARINEEEGSPPASSLLGKVLENRTLFHTLLKFGKYAQRPFTAGTPYIRHLPEIFLKGQGFRALPALAPRSFREDWPALAKKLPKTGRLRVGLFAGCAQDFIYPDQLKAAVDLFTAKGCQVVFPMDQTCCGLPVRMMGERRAAQKTALQNVRAFAAEGLDHIISLCPSCASHIRHSYAALLEGEGGRRFEVEDFTARITDFSSFMRDVLGAGAADIARNDEKVCYHAPCHLCRGLGVTEQPRALLRAGAEYLPDTEEDVCCGFGGSYSVKFPEVSSQVLKLKLDRLEALEADTLVTDCPGCVMQLGGGEEKRGRGLKVEHMSEFLWKRWKGE